MAIPAEHRKHAEPLLVEWERLNDGARICRNTK